jgi:hypothetical protein
MAMMQFLAIDDAHIVIRVVLQYLLPEGQQKGRQVTALRIKLIWNCLLLPFILPCGSKPPIKIDKMHVS